MISILPRNDPPPDPATPQHDPTEPAIDTLQAVSALEELVGDRYVVVRTLAIAGMSTVFELRHRFHGGRFAAKVLHSHLAKQTDLVRAFRQEAQHLALLSGHPNVVSLFDLIVAGDLHAMTLSYIEGEDLDQLMKRHGRFQRDEALLLAAQLASLLLAIEKAGIVHCDLSPGNIRLDIFGQYRVFDFGLSRLCAQGDHAALAQSGTPAYNSPEQIRGEHLDIRTDLYSLGVILFEVLTGEPPFSAPTLEELAAKHLAGDWTFPSELIPDAPLQDLLRLLIVADRNQRMKDTTQLVQALTAMGIDLGAATDLLSPEKLVPPKVRRKRLEPFKGPVS